MLKVLSSLVLWVVVPQLALAARYYEDQIRDGVSSSMKGGADEPAGSTDNPAITDTYGWPNMLVKNGEYRVMSNLWNNEASLGQAPASTYSGVVGWNGVAVKQPAAPWIGSNAAGDTAHPAELRMNVDDSSGGFNVTTWTQYANAYDTSLSPSPWRDERHYPVAYPAVYKGCHHSKCSKPSAETDQDSIPGQGGPLPIRIGDLASTLSSWTVSLPPPSQGAVYDVAYDIWLDIGHRPGKMHNSWKSGIDFNGFPEANVVATQPYGTEIMIWVNYSGYDGAAYHDPDANEDTGTIIRPAGKRVVKNAHIPSLDATAGTTWDIFVGHGRGIWPYATDDQEFDNFDVYWNIVSFVRRQPLTSFTNLDTTRFINYLYGNNPDPSDPANPVAGHCPIAYDGNGVPTWTTQYSGTSEYASDGLGNEPCAGPSWWLSSIEAGFEIWANGTGLTSTSFDVKPKASVEISTDRNTVDGRPVQNWHNYFAIYEDLSGACDGGESPSAVTYQITANRADSNANDLGITVQTDAVAMTSVFDQYWWILVKPMYSQSGTIIAGPGSGSHVSDVILHGDVTITLNMTCSSGIKKKTISMYVDPSGKVFNQNGAPISQATVTLWYIDPADGQWREVPNGSDVMSDWNRQNPMYSSDTIGAFGWDTLPGTYKVRAEYPGCYAPGDPSQPYVETPAITVPSPVCDLALTLYCPDADPGHRGSSPTVTLSTFNTWTGGKYGEGGYCNYIYVINNTGAAVTNWKGVVNVTDGDVFSPFNVSVSGNTVTASAPTWCNQLNPGQSSSQTCGAVQGYCVDKK